MEQNELHAKIEKCRFNQTIVPYLGMVISQGQILMDPMKLDGIAKWPVPTNLHEVRSFLGFANFYQKFISGYANITRPLDQLKKKDHKWEWTAECQNAFDQLKTAFLSKPILHLPDKS